MQLVHTYRKPLAIVALRHPNIWLEGPHLRARKCSRAGQGWNSPEVWRWGHFQPLIWRRKQSWRGPGLWRIGHLPYSSWSIDPCRVPQVEGLWSLAPFHSNVGCPQRTWSSCLALWPLLPTSSISPPSLAMPSPFSNPAAPRGDTAGNLRWSPPPTWNFMTDQHKINKLVSHKTHKNSILSTWSDCVR